MNEAKHSNLVYQLIEIEEY